MDPIMERKIIVKTADLYNERNEVILVNFHRRQQIEENKHFNDGFDFLIIAERRSDENPRGNANAKKIGISTSILWIRGRGNGRE
jgi:UDP-N-acetylglucosamine 2-epimerase